MAPFPQKYSGFCLAAFQSYGIQLTGLNIDFFFFFNSEDVKSLMEFLCPSIL